MKYFPHLSAVLAYWMWGLAFLFWSALPPVPSDHLLAYRVLFSVITLWAILSIFYVLKCVINGRLFFLQMPNRKQLCHYALAGLVVSINWYCFMYSAQIGRGVDASFGYFMVPFVSFTYSYFLLGERFSKVKWVAMGMALLASVGLFFSQQIILWIPFSIAIAFGSYGYLKKTGRLSQMTGALVETTALGLVIAVWMLFDSSALVGFFQFNVAQQWLFGVAGLVSLAPLAAFSYAAPRLRLSTLGWLQYTVPTLIFLIGIILMDNQLDYQLMLSLGLIWMAIVIVGLEHVGLKQWFKNKLCKQ